MKVWLDDERPMPDNYNIHVKTADEAIALLKTGKVESMSLDHDLGEGKTGYDVAKWIEENAVAGKLSKIKLKVHTQNPVGRKNICAALQTAGKLWMEHFRSVEEVTPNGTIYRVFLDGYMIGEFRNPYWASFIINAMKKEEI
jgi:hypothetical protein